MRRSSPEFGWPSVEVSSGGCGSRLGEVGGGARVERGGGGVEADVVSGISWLVVLGGSSSGFRVDRRRSRLSRRRLAVVDGW